MQTKQTKLTFASEAEVIEYAKQVARRGLDREAAMTSPDASRDYLVARFAGAQREEFVALWLDSQHKLIDVETLATGTLRQCNVYPREVVKSALRINAAAVVFAHNHPSGNAEASRADEMLTQALKQALTLVDVRTLDHIVVGGDKATSFAERGML